MGVHIYVYTYNELFVFENPLPNMKLKSVKAVQYADMMDMGGMPVRQPLPSATIEHADPFLLLHHHQGKVQAGRHPREVGVGPHPHRGFSPVTFIFKGDVHHRDSRGNSAVVAAGGVQWMDAGMGVMHSERPSAALAKSGGEQEIVQLWVNTPAAHKMDQPNYQALQKEDIPVVQADKGEGTIQVVAGRYAGITGPARTKLQLLMLRADFSADAQHTFEIPTHFHTLLYVVKGQIHVEKYGPVQALHMLEFQDDGEAIQLSTDQATTFLILAAEPLNEPIVQYGPFVMRNQTEILQAMRDYQMGKMGILIEEFEEQTS